MLYVPRNEINSEALLDMVGELLEKAFRQICNVTRRTEVGKLELYNDSEGYRCRARDFVSTGTTFDSRGQQHHRYEIPAVAMNGCLDLSKDLVAWLACDAQTTRRSFPLFTFQTIPGPALASVLGFDGQPLPQTAGMARFQHGLDCTVCVHEDVKLDGIDFRQELLLTQVDPNTALMTLDQDVPNGIKWRARYRMWQVGQRVIIRERRFHFTAKLPQLVLPPPASLFRPIHRNVLPPPSQIPPIVLSHHR